MATQQMSHDFKKWIGNSDMPAGKKKVVLAALRLFSQKGFDGTSTQEIAKESGMSQATIFKYFKTKEDLLEFIIKPMMQNIFPVYVDDFQHELIKNGSSLENLIHFAIHNRYHFLVDNREVASIFISEILTKEKVRAQFVKMVEKNGPDILQVFVKLANESDEIRSDVTPEDLIRLVVSQILVYFLQGYKVFGPKEPKQVERDLAEIERLVITAVKK